MKKNKFTLGWFFISLLMAFCVTACDDDDDNIVNVTFPQKQVIGGAAETTHQLTFDAMSDWQLTSSSTWCSFQTENGQKEYALAGKAGQQTVNVYLSTEGQDYDTNSVALITMAMNGQEAVIAEVTRNAVNRELKIFKKVSENKWVELAQGESIEAPRFNRIKQEEESYNYYMVQANFRFAASERPEWLSINSGAIVGSVNQKVIFGIKAVEDKPGYYKYAQKGNLTFQDEEGKSFFTFPVNYAGMDENALYLEGPDCWNWEVALNGKTFTQTSAGIAGSEEVSNVYNKFVEYTVTAFNDDFEAIFVEKYEQYPGYYAFKTSIYDPEAPQDQVTWMHLKKYENGKVRVTVDEAENEREGYVLVFPRALYDKIVADPWGEFGLFEMNPETSQQELKYEYTQANLLMNFIQKEQKQAGGNTEEAQFKVTYYTPDWSQAEAELTKVNDEGIISEFGTDQIFSMAQPNTPMGFTVDPLMGEDSYMTTWFFQVFQGDNLFTDNADLHTIACEDGKTLNVWFSTEYTLEREINIVIKDQMTWQTLKVLTITPKN